MVLLVYSNFESMVLKLLKAASAWQATLHKTFWWNTTGIAKSIGRYSTKVKKNCLFIKILYITDLSSLNCASAHREREIIWNCASLIDILVYHSFAVSQLFSEIIFKILCTYHDLSVKLLNARFISRGRGLVKKWVAWDSRLNAWDHIILLLFKLYNNCTLPVNIVLV